MNMMRRLGLVILTLGWSAFVIPEESWKDATPEYEWKFPEDHWARRQYRNEWWYFTGHLKSTGQKTRNFAYQMTFFRVGIDPDPPQLDSRWASQSLIMGHAAISDLDQKQHLFSEILFRETPFLGGFSEFPENLLAWSIGPPGTQGRWELTWNGEAFDFQMVDDRQGFRFKLVTTPLKSLIFQGPNGFSRKSDSPNHASHYYSFTRLKTRGEVQLGKERFQVDGISWMDKEFSSGALAENQIGWDWISLQLDSNYEFMVAQLRNRRQETDFSWANQISPTGEVTYLGESGWEMRPLRTWTSEQTEARYPVEWEIKLPNRVLRVIAEFDEQENCSQLYPGINYWEGAVRVEDRSGRRIGQGFLEMTGYGRSTRLPL